jgi:hypothetical protein
MTFENRCRRASGSLRAWFATAAELLRLQKTQRTWRTRETLW